jgi:prephenate dehydrogenase
MSEHDSSVAVVGLGLIGGSLGQAFKRKGLKVYGVSSRKTVEKAFELKAVDEGFDYGGLGEAVRKSGAVFVCKPLLGIGEAIPEVFRHAQRNAIVSDVGSTKAVICRIAEKCQKSVSHRGQARGVHFVGGHPMAGSEKSGIENSNPYLFYDAVYVLTPLANTPKSVVKRLGSLVGLLGAKVMILSPDLHDRIAAEVSHLPHLLAVLLANQLADSDSDLFRNLAAGGFRDMTRIASSSFAVWKDIIGTNIEEVRRSLADFRARADGLIERLDDERHLRNLFERANRERETIPKYSKGFLKPLCDVRVSVKDRPGELAKITNVAYYRGVNVKDIEIVNVREGEGGILRLGFSEKGDARVVASALEELGYEVSVPD